MLYKNLFFDLDDTLWAFSLNARDTYEEMYWKYGYNRYFDSFEHYYSLYQRRNLDLWAEYADGKVTKEELNRQRYLYPLEAVGAGDSTLAKAYERDALTMIPTKSKLMPHAREVLEYLSGKYNLYILSNGFKELQSHKMRSSGIDEYFKTEVIPFAPDAWYDKTKMKVGYEISFTKYFYKHEPLRDLAEIEADILKLEKETDGLLNEIIA